MEACQPNLMCDAFKKWSLYRLCLACTSLVQWNFFGPTWWI